jgi:sec-independent protein translocase protein TatA
MLNTLAIGMPVGAEWIVIGAIALLIFGKRLPEVGRSVGKSIKEFKAGLNDVSSHVTQVDEPAEETPVVAKRLPDPATATKPKFDPYTGKPIEDVVAEAAVVEETPKPKFDPYTGKAVEEPAGGQR